MAPILVELYISLTYFFSRWPTLLATQVNGRIEIDKYFNFNEMNLACLTGGKMLSTLVLVFGDVWTYLWCRVIVFPRNSIIWQIFQPALFFYGHSYFFIFFWQVTCCNKYPWKLIWQNAIVCQIQRLGESQGNACEKTQWWYNHTLNSLGATHVLILCLCIPGWADRRVGGPLSGLMDRQLEDMNGRQTNGWVN